MGLVSLNLGIGFTCSATHAADSGCAGARHVCVLRMCFV